MTHSRDIIVKILYGLKGYQSSIIYNIPIYMDKPKGIPTIEIKEHEIVLTFTNLEQQQTQNVLASSYTASGNPCKGIFFPAFQSSPSGSGSASILS